MQGENIYKSQASKAEEPQLKDNKSSEIKITGTRVVSRANVDKSKESTPLNKAVREGTEEINSQNSPDGQEKGLKKNFGNLRSGETLVNDQQQIFHGSAIKIDQLGTPATPISGHFLLPVSGINNKRSSNGQ